MTDTSPWANPDSDEHGPPDSGDTPAAGPATDEVDPPLLHASVTSGNSAAFIPLFGMMLLVLIALGVALAVYVQRDTTARFAAGGVGDKDEDLKAMGLRTSDVPSGLALAIRDTYSNEDWANQLSRSDPVAAADPDAPGRKTTQLASQGRVKNLISLFSWNELASSRQGQALAILAQSTVYETEDAAKADTSRLCGLSINEKDPLTEFRVPKIGDQSTGFTVLSIVANQRKTIDTVVCFRTGRIVHGVVQTSLDGSQDIGLVVSLAQRMEAHVARTFEGKAEPIDDDPKRQG